MTNDRIPGVKTFEYTKIIGVENIEFGHDIIIDDFVFMYVKGRAKIGDFVHIGSFTSIVVADTFEMAESSTVSHGVRVFTRSEDFKGWGFGNPTIPEEFRNIQSGPVSIERFCVIGANSVILPGVTIGEGATVGACSVVSKDLDPWGVYIGNRRTADRDREGVMENYRRFLSLRTDKV
jgi:acetyltransferase-like isoleucine patch superfamily enzyme